MLEGMVFLQSYGIAGGGTFGNLLAQLQAQGVFSYVLPFLLLFSLTFVVLGNLNLFKDNKAVNAIIALSVALMALQFDFVSIFFAEIFPRFGIALSVILVLVIVGGLFFKPENKGFKWLFVIIGLVIAAVVIFKSLAAFGFTGGSFFYNINWGNTLIVIGIIAAFIAVVSSGSRPEYPEVTVPFTERRAE